MSRWSCGISNQIRKQDKGGEGGMWKIVVTLGIWIVGAICVLVMKKIEPDDKIYPVWVLFIAIVFTLFAIQDWLS